MHCLWHCSWHHCWHCLWEGRGLQPCLELPACRQQPSWGHRCSQPAQRQHQATQCACVKGMEGGPQKSRAGRGGGEAGKERGKRGGGGKREREVLGGVGGGCVAGVGGGESL
eukprot:1159557-Pelagomonas_calceolata.AAC.20